MVSPRLLCIQETPLQPDNESNQAESSIAGKYAVACLDILGQRVAIRRACELGEAHNSTSDVLPALQQSLATLRKVRGAFEEQYRLVNRSTTGDIGREVLGNTPALSEVKTYSFADSVIAFTDIGFEPVTCYSVYAMLLSCAMLQAWTLSRGIPMRGGVDICWGLSLGQREVYGPALVEAHRLESEVARHARIVVGRGLLRYLEWAAGQPDAHRDGPKTRTFALNTKKFLFRDLDGAVAVDYLGPWIRESAEGKSDWIPVARKAIEFIKTEQARFVAARDAKLAPRYTFALRYCQSRAHLWADADHAGRVTSATEPNRAEVQSAVYDAVLRYLDSRGFPPRSAGYDWATGVLTVGVADRKQQVNIADLQDDLIRQGFLISRVIVEPGTA